MLQKGKTNIETPAMKQTLIKILAPIPILILSQSHENDIKPMIPNKKPRKVRETHGEWHRDNKSVGTFVLKGPNCTKCGLVNQTIGFSEEPVLTPTRPRALFVRGKPLT
jgi:hypothetical protein